MKATAWLLWIVIVFHTSNALANSGLCKAEEINFMSCIIGEKVASFCASKDLTQRDGYLQYRFGTTQRLELTFPTNRSHPTGQFFRSMSPDGLENRISFRNGPHTYMFFSIDSPQGAAFGIHILKSGKLARTLPCSEQFSDQNPMPYSFIKMEEFVWFKR